MASVTYQEEPFEQWLQMLFNFIGKYHTGQ